MRRFHQVRRAPLGPRADIAGLWGWRRLLRRCAKSPPYQLRTRPPEVSEAVEIRASLAAVLAKLDRHLRDRGVSVAPTTSNGGMTL
jgi:hypothetical protein